MKLRPYKKIVTPRVELFSVLLENNCAHTEPVGGMENRRYHHIILPDTVWSSFGLIQETSPARDEFTFMVCSEDQYHTAMRYNVGTVSLWNAVVATPGSLLCSVVSTSEDWAIIEIGANDYPVDRIYYCRYKLTHTRLTCMDLSKISVDLPEGSMYREYYPNAHTMEFPGELSTPKYLKETILIMARYLSDGDKDLLQNLWKNIDTWAENMSDPLPSLSDEEILPRALLLAVSANKEQPFALIVNCKIYPEDQELFRPALNLCWDKYTAIVKPSLSSMVTADEKKFMELVRDNQNTHTVRRLYYDTLACQHRTRELQQQQGIK